MRPRDLAALEFNVVLDRLGDFAVSPAGRQACGVLLPASDRAAAEREIERVWQCFRLAERHGDVPIRQFPDIHASLQAAAHEGYVLDGKALVEIRTVLIASREAGAFLRRHEAMIPSLIELAADLRRFPEIESTLARSLDAEGNVQDQASDELAAMRESIRRLRDTLTSRLEDLVRRKAMADVVGDEYVTIRNNRFVIPVRAASARRISGVVQDRSVSGETLFIEPLFAVDLNNQLLVAIREQEAIVRKLLADMTNLVRTELDAIAAAFRALAYLDTVSARVKFAHAYRCVQPRFSVDQVRVHSARHPGLLFTGRPVTPIDIDLAPGKRVLVITGPNTGGKTVALKTFGLLALMAQSGMLIPAEEGSEIPFFSAVFADVGDEQNIERNLSTFSAHITNLCEILERLSAPEPAGAASLVLLDEPGVGTDPEEGAALAIGLLLRLESLGAYVVVTTHYMPVKLFSLSNPAMVTAAVDVDLETFVPRYRLVYGSIGRSLALPIAERLGLPQEVLAGARAARAESARVLDNALDQLESSRRKLEKQIAEIEERDRALRARESETQKLLADIKEKRRRVWSAELREAREFVRRIKEEGREVLAALAQDVRRRPDLHRYTREQEATIAEQARTLEESGAGLNRDGIMLCAGDQVEVGEHAIRGELLSIQGDRAWIQRGSLRFEVPAGQLRRLSGKAGPAAVRIEVASGIEAPRPELSLVGLRARDAVERLRLFLDRAAQAQHATVKIIHGIGSGALRRAVREHLATSPYCRDFRNGQPEEGGDGVTIVVLE